MQTHPHPRQPATPNTARQKPTAFMTEFLKPQTVTVDILLVTPASASPCRRSTQGFDYQDRGTAGGPLRGHPQKTIR